MWDARSEARLATWQRSALQDVALPPLQIDNSGSSCTYRKCSARFASRSDPSLAPLEESNGLESSRRRRNKNRQTNRQASKVEE